MYQRRKRSELLRKECKKGKKNVRERVGKEKKEGGKEDR